ncbi:MAG: threonine/serine dehydratase [Pseudomonadota bacterium]
MSEVSNTAPDFSDLRSAAERLEGRAVRTPLLESPLMNRAAGRRVLVKAEALQRTGSFKFRGAWSHLSMLDDPTAARGVLAYSSGNHAQGVACAAQMLGLKATIVMPKDAPATKVENTRAYGADVVLYDRMNRESREELGARLIEERGLHLVKPYDDPLVIAGQGSVGLELAQQAHDAGVETAEVSVCCGGGGLASGVALALAEDAPGLRVRTAEPEGFDDWARSLQTGARQRNEESAGSICDAILTPEPGELTWPIGQRLFGPGIAVTELEARKAMAMALRHLKITLEPGGAVGLAAALFHPEEMPGDAVIAVATGGNVDADRFWEWTRFDTWDGNGLPH